MASPRPFLLTEANHQQLTIARPNVAVLPWGATEAHNLHLPYGTDVIEATTIAELAAEAVYDPEKVRVAVLPTIPFGNNEQQLDQAATISFRTSTAFAVLRDVVRSLTQQGIDRLIILNAHGGNQFQPLVRDLQSEYECLILVANFYEMAPEVKQEVFEQSGDHADEMETSLLLHLCPELVVLDQAGEGTRMPFTVKGTNQPGVWTPRPWSRVHPDTGSGDPRKATAKKGQQYLEAVVAALAKLIVGVAQARKGELPYL